MMGKQQRYNNIIALKAIMPALLLEKASKILKAKDHLKALERRPRSREEGNITNL